jgi:hypothetical protein
MSQMENYTDKMFFPDDLAAASYCPALVSENLCQIFLIVRCENHFESLKTIAFVHLIVHLWYKVTILRAITIHLQMHTPKDAPHHYCGLPCWEARCCIICWIAAGFCWQYCAHCSAVAGVAWDWACAGGACGKCCCAWTGCWGIWGNCGYAFGCW